MTLVPLADGDRDAALRFLATHEAQSMFLIANFMGQGQPMQAWVARHGGRIAGLLGLTDDGMILPQWPGADWTVARPLLAGRGVEGMLGPAAQVAGLRAALGLTARPTRHDGVEPGYRLDLQDLALPDCDGFSLRAVEDAAAVARWRADYETELFATPPAEAEARATDTVARWQAAGSHRVLWRDGQPVALAGFNARLPEVAQVGGVYVPPDLRGHGHGRRAVGLLLAEARAQGLRRAVLFAASAAAARVYQLLGFRPAGAMGLVLFQPPLPVVPPCP